MNPHTNHPIGGANLEARLELACIEGRRLRIEHRDTLRSVRRAMVALRGISFTRAEGLDVTAPLSRDASD